MSGADRLPNGNTLICDGVHGMIFEVTPQKETVWIYVIPDQVGTPSGDPAAGGPSSGPIDMTRIIPAWPERI